MHELGIVFQIVNTLETVVKEENLPAIDTVVLQVGQLSGVIPIYLDECWPAATDKHPFFKDTKLKIEVVQGLGKCKNCGEIFNIIDNEGYCPKCNSFEKDVISGREFIIKEILVPEVVEEGEEVKETEE